MSTTSPTVVVGARVPVTDAALFQRQAERAGLTTSQALGALISTAVADDRDAEQSKVARLLDELRLDDERADA